jgi:hypothetical protein
MFKLSFNIVNSALIDVSIAHYLFHGTSGAKSTYYHGSCSFLLIQLCSNVCYCFYLCFSRQMRQLEAKELIKKMFFYCDGEALKVFRKYRCHPAIPKVRDDEFGNR